MELKADEQNMAIASKQYDIQNSTLLPNIDFSIEACEKISNAKLQVKSSKETFELTTEEYMQGLSSMLELIDAQYTDFEAKRNLINAEAEYQMAAVLLKRKTGLLIIDYSY